MNIFCFSILVSLEEEVQYMFLVWQNLIVSEVNKTNSYNLSSLNPSVLFCQIYSCKTVSLGLKLDR